MVQQQQEELQPAAKEQLDPPRRPNGRPTAMDNFQEGVEESKEEVLSEASSADDKESPPVDEFLDHLFSPGDHVIRWEMLPIAWPIQIHGIVLETTKSSVTLADFGLTAKPVDEHSTENDLKDTPVQPFIDHPVSHKVEQAVASAWEKFRPKQETKQRRQRITVQTITDPKELSRWKKVNYGGNLFGGGGSEEDDCGNKSAAGNRRGTWLKKMTSSWNSNDGSSPRTPERKKDGDLSNSGRTVQVDDAKQNASAEDGSAVSTEQQADSKSWWRRMPDWNCERSLVGYSETPEKQRRVVGSTADDSAVAKDREADWSQRKMNPAMAKLIAEKGKDVAKPSEEISNEACKQGKILPKADPRKLILARTRFLLEHGESVLPAYVRSQLLCRYTQATQIVL